MLAVLRPKPVLAATSSPSPPCFNGGEGRGEEALLSRSFFPVRLCRPGALTGRCERAGASMPPRFLPPSAPEGRPRFLVSPFSLSGFQLFSFLDRPASPTTSGCTAPVPVPPEVVGALPAEGNFGEWDRHPACQSLPANTFAVVEPRPLLSAFCFPNFCASAPLRAVLPRQQLRDARCHQRCLPMLLVVF